MQILTFVETTYHLLIGHCILSMARHDLLASAYYACTSTCLPHLPGDDRDEPYSIELRSILVAAIGAIDWLGRSNFFNANDNKEKKKDRFESRVESRTGWRDIVKHRLTVNVD